MRFSLLFLIFFTFFVVGCSTASIKEKKSYTIYLDKNYINSLDFKNSDLIATNINNQWYFVKKDGEAMPVMSDDDGMPDKFKEGLARVKINGKIGFFNRNLDIVIEPFYSYAFPFHKGISEICIGCKEVYVGEHSMLSGGKWKRIDRTGLIVEE
jgi:hypothetical protein